MTSLQRNNLGTRLRILLWTERERCWFLSDKPPRRWKYIFGNQLLSLTGDYQRNDDGDDDDDDDSDVDDCGDGKS